ncbi:uncharacterized protein BXZ73DRAFT_78420 [Epithele typhae]|uniref:uncharacterized protein n=1 Tax=Epithele typhae TaxID=378194 RepID=UPI0020082FB7|nr:uncharacterized protein BXZ73DRAFT_78420 [Epithele typhae]KAH9927968.1 hypothetical protein BXZ73DRAFT_78420 [Epithele typhae]
MARGRAGVILRDPVRKHFRDMTGQYLAPEWGFWAVEVEGQVRPSIERDRVGPYYTHVLELWPLLSKVAALYYASDFPPRFRLSAPRATVTSRASEALQFQSAVPLGPSNAALSLPERWSNETKKRTEVKLVDTYLVGVSSGAGASIPSHKTRVDVRAPTTQNPRPAHPPSHTRTANKTNETLESHDSSSFKQTTFQHKEVLPIIDQISKYRRRNGGDVTHRLPVLARNIAPRTPRTARTACPRQNGVLTGSGVFPPAAFVAARPDASPRRRRGLNLAGQREVWVCARVPSTETAQVVWTVTVRATRRAHTARARRERERSRLSGELCSCSCRRRRSCAKVSGESRRPSGGTDRRYRMRRGAQATAPRALRHAHTPRARPAGAGMSARCCSPPDVCPAVQQAFSATPFDRDIATQRDSGGARFDIHAPSRRRCAVTNRTATRRAARHTPFNTLGGSTKRRSYGSCLRAPRRSRPSLAGDACGGRLAAIATMSVLALVDTRTKADSSVERGGRRVATSLVAPTLRSRWSARVAQARSGDAHRVAWVAHRFDRRCKRSSRERRKQWSEKTCLAAAMAPRESCWWWQGMGGGRVGGGGGGCWERGGEKRRVYMRSRVIPGLSERGSVAQWAVCTGTRWLLGRRKRRRWAFRASRPVVNL